MEDQQREIITEAANTLYDNTGNNQIDELLAVLHSNPEGFVQLFAQTLSELTCD